MTETKWLAGKGHLYNLISHLEKREGTGRGLRLFGCACCRRVWDLLRPGASRRIVELAEAYADGEETEADVEELKAVYSELINLDEQIETGTFTACFVGAIIAARCLAYQKLNTTLIVQETSLDPSRDFILSAENNFGLGRGPPRDEAEFAEKKKILRDIFYNPFRVAYFNQAWRTTHTIGIATKMYEERDFSYMPILADALEEAGCTHTGILKHCRGDGPHVRGCWVVDLVLNKGQASRHTSEGRSPA